MSGVGFRLGNRPALDGIRGCAIVAVIGLHAGLGLPGGFLGVQVFFVLSGFMISSVLLEEVRNTERISLPRFYMRRVLRLLPTFFVVLAAVVLYAIVFPHRHSVDGLGGEALAATFYVANWVYASAGNLSHLLVHTWSLSVEEQFYLVWPPILALLIARGFKSPHILAFTAVGIVCSAGARFLLYTDTNDRVDRLYFGSDTRVDALLIGCALAVIAYAGQLPQSRVAINGIRVAAVVSILGIAVSMRELDRHSGMLYRSGFFLIALGSAAVISLVLVSEAGIIGRLLSWRPLAGIGRMSYGLYLWHLPIFYMVAESAPDLARRYRVGISIVASVAVAALNRRFVEAPFLAMKDRLYGTRAGAQPPAVEPVLPAP